MYLNLPIHLFTYLSIDLPAVISAYQNLSIYLSNVSVIHPSIHLSIGLPTIYLFCL